MRLALFQFSSILTEIVVLLGLLASIVVCQFNHARVPGGKESFCGSKCRSLNAGNTLFARRRQTFCINRCLRLYEKTSPPKAGLSYSAPSLASSRFGSPVWRGSPNFARIPQPRFGLEKPLYAGRNSSRNAVGIKGAKPISENFKISDPEKQREVNKIERKGNANAPSFPDRSSNVQGVELPVPPPPPSALRPPPSFRRRPVSLPAVQAKQFGVVPPPVGLPAPRVSLARPNPFAQPVRRVCRKPSGQPCLSKPAANAKVYQCCLGQKLSPSCIPLCNYDISSSQLKAAYLGKKCSVPEFERISLCGTNHQNVQRCCQDLGVFNNGRERCAPFCYPAGGLPKPSFTYFKCFGQYEKIQQCYWSSQA